MISDEERREVAQRMRHEITFMRINREWYESEDDAVECGNRAFRDIAHSAIPYSNIHCDYIMTVERLAKLIDRPTGIAMETPDGYGKCHTCGVEFIVSVPAAFRCEEENEADYCPCCGTPFEWRYEDDQ